MILLNWLIGLRGNRTHSRKSNLPRPAVVRHDMGPSVECLEERCVLSAVSNAYSLPDASWFATVTSNVTAQSGNGLSGASNGSSSSSNSERQFLVRLTPEAVEQARSPQQAQTLFANNGAGLRVVRGLGLPGQLLLATGERDSVRIVAALQNNPNVAHYEEDYAVGAAEPRFPNEQTQSPFFDDQYGLHIDGTNNVDINAPEAWFKTTGSSQIVVSVIDSGVDVTHPDLYQNIWLNNAELPAPLRMRLVSMDGVAGISFRDLNHTTNRAMRLDENNVNSLLLLRDLNVNGYIDAADLLDDPLWADGIDGDKNGFEDDLVGWDFQENDNKPFDEHGHGTHVAGILGAEGDNASTTFNGGVVGVVWTTSILPLRFLDENNTGDLSDAIEAINYQTLLRTSKTSPANIRVSNNSWGTSGSLSQELFDAVAATGEADILFVAAAGNGDVLGRGIDNDQTPFFPANLDLPNVISVGAFGRDGALARFSNFGDQSVDIAAPGVGIVSTSLGGTFITRNGTSMAAPFVSGTAALVYAEHLDASAVEVREAILSGASTSAVLLDRIVRGRQLNAAGALAASTFAPIPRLVAIPDIASTGVQELVVTVAYEDDTGVNTAAFDVRDLEITRRGFSQFLLRPFAATSTMVDGQPAAVYRFAAPGGTWDETEFGTYDVRLREGEIVDLQGLYSSPRLIGSFNVTLSNPAVIFVNTTADTSDANLLDGTPADAQGKTSLRAAIMHANRIAGPSTIIVSDGVYALTIPGRNEDASATGDLDLTSVAGITLMGGGAFSTIIDAQQLDRVFHVKAGATATLRGITIRNGNTDVGGGLFNDGFLSMRETIVSGNTAETDGGGVFSAVRGLLIEDSSVEGNRTTSRFVGKGGGGVAVRGNPFGFNDPVTITNSSIVGNTSSNEGGGLLAQDTNLRLTNVTISGNTALRGDGGGLLVVETGRHALHERGVQLTNVTLTNNNALNGRSGGLAAETIDAQLLLSHSIVAENRAKLSPDVDSQVISDGTNLFGQPSQSSVSWRRLASGVADFDQIGTTQSPLDPGLLPLERSEGVVQTHSPVSSGLAANSEVAGHAMQALTSGLPIVYSTAELEPNNSRGQAMRLDERGWSLGSNPDISNSTAIPHVTITGTGDGSFDFYSFTVSQAGSTAVFDIDNGSIAGGASFNTELFLFNSSGALLASNDDSVIDAGSSSGLDSRIEHQFTAAGYYTIAVGAFNSQQNGAGSLTGSAPLPGSEYVLHVSLAGHFLAPLSYTASADLITGTVFGDGYLFSARDSAALFQPHVSYATGSRPKSVTMGDVNGDGVVDALITNNSDASISVLIGNGDGSFRSPVKYGVVSDPNNVALGDVNGDSILDAVVGSRTNGSLLIGNGDGTFRAATTLAVGTPAEFVALSDTNADGKLDLISIGPGPFSERDNVSVQLGNGNGTFGSGVKYTAGNNPLSGTVGDVNHDGITDIVTANNASNDVSVLLGRGDGTFQPAVNYTAGNRTSCVALGDVDSDGIVDLVAGNELTKDVRVLIGIGDGTFRESVSYSTGGETRSVGLGDVNGDGVTDVITADFNAGFSVLVGNGDGTFQPPITRNAGEFPVGVAVGDLNGDGVSDVITANRFGDNVSVLVGKTPALMQFHQGRLISIPSPGVPKLFADAGGKAYFVTHREQPDEMTLWSVTEDLLSLRAEATYSPASIADRPDRTVWTGTKLFVLSQMSFREFDPESGLLSRVGLPDGTFDRFALATGNNPESVATGDLNGDGITDIVTVNSANEFALKVLIGSAGGGFHFAVGYQTGSFFAKHVSLGDVDNDGDLDAITADGSNRVKVLVGNGDGTFQTAVSYLVSNAASSSFTATADLNGDGASDIVAADSSNDRISVLIANGNGTFQSAVNYTAGDFPETVALGDVNGDGRIDAVTSNAFSGNVSVFLGNGDGTFGGAASYPTVLGNPRFVALKDLNGDGRSDVVTTSNSKNEVCVLLANPNGTLQTAVRYAFSKVPFTAALGDVNADGINDIVTVNSPSNDISVLTGFGDGTFLPAVSYRVGFSPTFVVLDDVNGDGLTDIITADSGSSRVSVLANSTSVLGAVELDGDTFVINNVRLEKQESNESNFAAFRISDVESRDATLQQSDYDLLRIQVFEEGLLIPVRLKNSTPRPGELDVLQIDPETGDAISLLRESNIRLRASEDDLLVVEGETIYLTAEIIGAGTGSELLSYDRRSGLRLVADVLPGPEGSQVRDLFLDGSKVYFTALARRVDNSTGNPVLYRELFVLDPATNSVRSVRAGREVTGPPSLAGSTLFFNSQLASGGSDFLWSYDTTQDGAPSLGAFDPVAGTISGTAFLDSNANGRQDEGEPGRAGVTIFVDLNGNGRREAIEPAGVTRQDDPATFEQEAGRFSIAGLTAGTYQLRELPTDGFVQTAPLMILPTNAELTPLATATAADSRTDLGLPSVVGENVVYVNLASGQLIRRDANGDEQALVHLDSDIPGEAQMILSLGASHAQDGSGIGLTATVADGRELVLTVNSRGQIQAVAQTGSVVGGNLLTDIEDLSNRGFDSLSFADGNVGFLAETSPGVERYFLGEPGQLAVFQHAQVVLDGGNEIFVDRVVEGATGTVLTGNNLFLDKAALDAQVGGNTGWQITTRVGDEILPLTFFNRIFDVSVSGLSIAFRASDSSGDEAIYVASVGRSASRLVETATPIPGGTGSFTAFGSFAGGTNAASLAWDGENLAFVGQGPSGQIGLYALINGSLRTIADRHTNFGGRTLADLAISHQALSGNRIVFHATFSNGTEAIYQATLQAQAVVSVSVAAGGTADNVSFGASAVPGTILGVSFTDANGNRLLDAGETVNENRTVFIDENLNGALDQNEIQTVTNSDGRFVFSRLAALTDYTIREVLPTGFVQTTARNLAEATVTLGAAQTLEFSLGSSFGDTGGQTADGRVLGVVFNDLNGDGDQDTGELGVSGVTVFVDENNDRVLNGGERSTVTIAADDPQFDPLERPVGSYVLDQLGGSRHAVRVVIASNRGFEQSRPLGNTFTTATIGLQDSPAEVVSGDFDGDGDDDLAASIDATNRIRFFVNNGSGTFTPGAAVDVDVAPGSLAVGRFAIGSNRVGLVVGHRDSNSVRVLLPQSIASGANVTQVELVNPLQTIGNGSFRTLGNGPYLVTTGNFDGDGDDDIAVVSQNGSSDGAVAIFLSNGAGAFSHEQTLVLPRAVTNSPSAIVAAELTGDGRLDLAVAGLLSNNVRVLRNTGNAGSGRFELGPSVAVGGNGPLSMQAGDLDNDGDRDLVTTNFGSDNVSILRNNGNGTFAAAGLRSVGRGPAGARIIDLDQDGNLDIAFTNSEAANRFGVLRNRGGGVFQAAELSGLADLSSRTLAFALAVGQFNDDNGDGAINSADTPDVVVSNRRDENIGARAGSLTIGRNSIVAGALQVEFTGTVREVGGLNFALQRINPLPTLNAIGNQTIDEDEPDASDRTVTFSGVSDGGDGSQALRVRASSNNVTLFPSVSVSYEPGAVSGSLELVPSGNQNGTATISVDVTDAGFDGQFDTPDDATTTQWFVVTVRSVNDAPMPINDNVQFITGSVGEFDVIANDDMNNPDAGESLRLLFLPAIAGQSAEILNGARRIRYTAPMTPGIQSLSYVVTDNQTTAMGQITVTVIGVIDAGNEDLIVRSNQGRLEVLRNNVVDPSFSAIMSSGVSTLRIIGGAAGQRIDLSGVTRAAFSAAGGVTLHVTAGGGDDTLIGSEFNDQLDGGDGTDLLTGGDGNDSLTGGIGKDSLTGGLGKDTLRGDAGDDCLIADPEDVGGAGNSTLDGGVGIDKLIVTTNAGRNSDFVLAGSVSSATLQFSVLTTAVKTTLVGLERAELLGGDGNNVLRASGFSGMVTLSGGGGDDSLEGGSAADSLVGGSGKDTLKGGNGNDTLVGEAGDLTSTLDGGGGVDCLSISASGTLTLTTTALSFGTVLPMPKITLAGFEKVTWTGGENGDSFNATAFTFPVTLSGGGGDDILTGGTKEDMLVGGTGQDLLTGGLGRDSLDGQEGNDTLVGDKADATATPATRGQLKGGSGDDLLQFTNDSALTLSNAALFLATTTTPITLQVTLESIERAQLTGGAAANAITAAATGFAFTSGPVTLSGGAGNDTLTGTAFADSLLGEDGNDQINGGDGNDTIKGGNNDDVLTGGNGDDAILGNAGKDVLNGNDGRDTLIGGADNDILKGGAQDDLLIGGSGVDNLDGESGNDRGLGGQGGVARGGTGTKDLGDVITTEIIDELFADLFAFE